MVLLGKGVGKETSKKLGVIFYEESIGSSPFSAYGYELMYVHGLSNIL